MRDRLWASIDNDDSRDLDQLSVAEPLANGAITIFVAIADVDATVPDGSAIDAHARTNTTSVYTAAGIFPMLPEKLSTDITSLNEGESRLAVVVAMTVTADGDVTDSEIFRAHVFNHAQLTYNGVSAWLDGEAPMPPKIAAVPGLEDQIRLQDRAAQAMNARRHQRGALDLKTLQARPVFEGDVIADLRPDHDNRAKAMIEDFMIAANSVTAAWLDAQGSPSHPPRPPHSQALGAHRRSRGGSRRTPAGRARRIGAADVPDPPASGRSRAIRGPVAVGGQAAWLG